MNDKMPWNFEAQQKSIRIHPGEMTNVVYEVVNTTNRETVVLQCQVMALRCCGVF